MRAFTCAFFALLVTTAACYSDDPQPQYAGDSGDAGDADDNADLVEVSPGVEVIADYDEPIFYADNYYWVNRGGIWYSSSWYRGGWSRAGEVPGGVRGIAHPEGYAHYRPTGYVGHARVHGGYAAHTQYHAAHASSSVHVRAAPHGGSVRHR